jgi:hypothetical protein
MMNIRRTGGLTVPRALGAIALASSLLGFGFACVDPKGDYDDYLERTNGIRGVQPETSVTEFETGEVDIDAGKATYFWSCLPGLFSGAPETSILLYSEANVSGGKVDFTNFPLKDTATKFLKSETVGASHGAMGVPLSGTNTFSAVIGTATIPGNSQRITDNDLTLEGVVFEGRILTTDRWCAELNGKVTKPTPNELKDPGDFCVIVKLNEGDDLPTFTDSSGKKFVGFAASEYHCP